MGKSVLYFGRPEVTIDETEEILFSYFLTSKSRLSKNEENIHQFKYMQNDNNNNHTKKVECVRIILSPDLFNVACNRNKTHI